MSKKTDELAVKKEADAPAIPAELSGGMAMEGVDQDDFLLPRMHLFQDTGSERESIGKDFEMGDLIDKTECRKLASNVIVPMAMYKSWAKWEEGEKPPIYSTRDKLEVPAEDLEWNDGTPPAATEMFNFVVMVEGEFSPYLLVFKRTGVKAAKTLLTMQRTRDQMKRGPGRYRVTWSKENGTKGVYAKMNIRADGDPNAEMLQQVAAAVSQYGDLSQIKAADEEDVPDWVENG